MGNTADIVKPLAIFIPLELFTCLLVTLRFVTRLKIKKVALGLEDYCILIAFLITVAESFVVVSLFHLGFGVHIWNLTESQRDHAKLLQIFWVTSIIFFIAMMLVKVSVLLLYRRVFIAHKKFRIACDIILGFILLYSVAASISTVFTCKPVEFYWTKVFPDRTGHCSKPLEAWDPYFALNLATDFILVVLPMPMLQALQIQKRKKYILITVFILGLVPCIAGVLRLKPIQYAADPDLTYWMSEIVILAGVELTTAIICATVPALTPLVSVYFPKLLAEDHTEPVVVPEAIREDGIISPTFSLNWNRRRQRNDSMSAPLSPGLPWAEPRPVTRDTIGRISEESSNTNHLAVPKDLESGLKHNSWSIMHEILHGSKTDLPKCHVEELEDMSASTSQNGRSGATSAQSIHFVDDDETDAGTSDIVAPIQDARQRGHVHFQPLRAPTQQGSIRGPHSVQPSVNSVDQSVGQSRLLMSRNLKHSAKPSIIDSVIQSVNHSANHSVNHSVNQSINQVVENGGSSSPTYHNMADLSHSPGPSISQSINPSVTFSITRSENHSANPSVDNSNNRRNNLRGTASRSRNLSASRSRRPSYNNNLSSNINSSRNNSVVSHSSSNSQELTEMTFYRESSVIDTLSRPSVIEESESELQTSWLRLSRSTYHSTNTNNS